MQENKSTFPYKPQVHIKNRSQREYKAKKHLSKLRNQVVRKIMQMAGIKKLSKADLYDLAEEKELNRYLYKNTVSDLETFLEHLRTL